MSRTTNASRNIIWGTLGRGIGLILPFVCRTVMINTIGIEYVGLSGLFPSLLVVLSFAELGIGVRGKMFLTSHGKEFFLSW